MARVGLTALVGRAVGGEGDALRAQRIRGARAIMERVWSYPKQREAILQLSSAKFATLQANRGGGKTEGIASWGLARCLSRSGYVVRIGTQTLEGPTDNILDRDGHEFSTLGWLERLGLRDHARVQRVGQGSIKHIRFAWGSAIHVHDFETLRALERKRGSTAHLWWFDEAQSMAMLSVVFATLVVPRLADHDGQVVFSGTPGRDVGTMFHRAATGDAEGWTRLAYYSYDNVLHGQDDVARWHRVLDTTVIPARKRYGLRTPDVERMRALSRDERVAIAENNEDDDLREWVAGLDPDLLREVFGRWVVGVEELLFAWPKAGADFYFAACGPYYKDDPHASPVCLWETSAPVAPTIADRVRLLPRAGTQGNERPASWFAVIGLDIGFVAPSAWVVLVYANDVPAAYCVWSETATGLLDSESIARTIEIVHELGAAGITTQCVVADINGMRQGTGAEWDRTLRQRLPSTVPIMEAYKVDEDSQMMALNLDIVDGRLRIVCGDALDICGRHLRWKPHDPASPQPARPDLGREVTLPDDTTCYPSNHATDALRYAAMRVPLLMQAAEHQPKRLTATESAVWLHERERSRMMRR